MKKTYLKWRNVEMEPDIIKYKKINITAGFKQTDSQFTFSLDVKATPVLLLIIAFKAVKEYKNFSVRNELQ